MTELELVAQELRTDPQAMGYATMADIDAAKAMTTPYTTRVVPTPVGIGRIMSALGAARGGAFFDALDSAAVSDPVLRWTMAILQSGGTIDVGDTEARAQLDALAANGVISAQDAADVKALAEVPASRADLIGVPAPLVPELVHLARVRGLA